MLDCGQACRANRRIFPWGTRPQAPTVSEVSMPPTEGTD